MRAKAWVLVDDLKRKIDLALARRLVADWAALAKSLNASEKTIRWWIQGSAGHNPGEMPKEAYEAFSAIFAQALQEHSGVIVARLVAGPAIELEDALALPPVAVELLSFIRDAIDGEGRLVSLGHDPGLVEIIGQRPSENLPKTHLRTPFRIEFKAMRGVGQAIVLQHAGLRWGAIEATPDRTNGIIHAPGIDPDGHPLTMREAEQKGVHTFYCIQTKKRPYASLATALAEPVDLDRRVLGMVSRFYDEQPIGERRCQALSIKVVRRPRRTS